MPLDASTPPPTGTPKRSRAHLARRYGPLAVVLTVLLVASVLATVRGPGDLTAAGAKAAPVGSGQEVPKTLQQALLDRTELDTEWVENCDFRTLRISVPSVYAPPCVPRFEGDNGGATSPGVTEDTIKIVSYRPPSGSDLASAFSGLTDTEEDVRETGLAYTEMMTELFETYGRRIEFIRFEGSGEGDDEAAAKADAIKVAEEIKPFASISGPGISHAYAEELAKRGILCIACAISMPDAKVQDLAPYVWGLGPTPEQYLRLVSDYVGRRLFRRKAEHAGPALRDKERVFGVVHFEQDPPIYGSVTDLAERQGEAVNYETKVTETYTLDIAKLPERAASIVAKLKAEGVTTVLFLGDPLMPGNLASAAEAQGYEPEWIVTGTVYTDTTVMGRQYNQKQWARAFGISLLAGRVPQEMQDGYRLHEWFYGEPPTAAKTSGVIYGALWPLMLGIHMAGPNLTPATFREGMFNYPPSGGGPTTPQISYGEHGYFAGPDYMGIDDATEIWWNAELTGPDEQGRDGKGMWTYAQRGKRYLPAEMPVTPPDVFTDKDAITLFEPDVLTPEDVPPDYGERYQKPR
jgi:hypothetical protein